VKTRKEPKRPIRVVFLVLYFEAWDSLSLVYQSMLDDPNFEPVVVSLPRKLTGDEGYGGEKRVHKFLKRLGIEHLRLSDEDSWSSLETLKQLEPDYVFLNYPWQRNYQPAFRPDSLVTFTRILYTPYFLAPLVNEAEAPAGGAAPGSSRTEAVAAHLYTQRAHQLASLVFVQDQATKDAFESVEGGGERVVFSGSPKLDSLRENFSEVMAKKLAKVRRVGPEPKFTFSVLWAPHHSYSPAWLNFGMFSNSFREMLDLAKRYPSLRFVLRPHPFLFGTLADRGVLDPVELQAWLKAWKTLPNTKTNSKVNFVKQFANTDLLLTDGISFLAEYPLITGKSGVFLENPGHWEFNTLGRLAAAANTRVSTVAEFEAVLLSKLASLESSGLPAVLPAGLPADSHADAIAHLRQAIDPNPGAAAAIILDAVQAHFATSPGLIDSTLIKDLPWEDQPGREPRTD